MPVTNTDPEYGATSRPMPCNINDLDGLLFLPVWSQTEPSAAGLLSRGRSAAYAAATDGSLPTVKVGGRLLVSTAKLLDQLGLDPETVRAVLGITGVSAPVADSVAL